MTPNPKLQTLTHLDPICPQVRQLLTTLGTTAPQLDLAAAPVIPDILASLPQDLRILCMYLAPDKCTLYMAAINIPNPDAPPPLPPTPPAAKNAVVIPPPVDPSIALIPLTITLVERGHLKSDVLERLVARLRVYRRWASAPQRLHYHQCSFVCCKKPFLFIFINFDEIFIEGLLFKFAVKNQCSNVYSTIIIIIGGGIRISFLILIYFCIDFWK